MTTRKIILLLLYLINSFVTQHRTLDMPVGLRVELIEVYLGSSVEWRDHSDTTQPVFVPKFRGPPLAARRSSSSIWRKISTLRLLAPVEGSPCRPRKKAWSQEARATELLLSGAFTCYSGPGAGIEPSKTDIHRWKNGAITAERFVYRAEALHACCVAVISIQYKGRRSANNGRKRPSTETF